MLDSNELALLVLECVEKNIPFKNHNNLVVVGDNKSGKTNFLRLLFGKVIDRKLEDYYYIDAKNRSITDDSQNSIGKRYIDYNVLDLLRERTSKSVMTINDYFTEHDPGALVTISELLAGREYYESLFSEFYQVDIDLEEVQAEKEYTDRRSTLLETSIRSTLLINGQDIQSLCSSEASELRLIMEVNNAREKKCKVVVIDEVDIHFDNRRMPEFLETMVSYFSELRFIFVIHNADSIVDMSNMDACIFNVTKDRKHKIIDCNDIHEYGQIDRIKNKYMEIISDVDILLERCVDSFIKEGNLAPDLAEQYKKIDSDKLSGRALVWYRYLGKGLK